MCFGTAYYLGMWAKTGIRRYSGTGGRNSHPSPKPGLEGEEKEFRLKATIEKWASTQILSSSVKQAGPMGLGQEVNVSVGNSLGSRQASLIAVCPSVKSGPQARRFTCFACSG